MAAKKTELEKLIESKSTTVDKIKKFEAELPVLSTGLLPLDIATGAQCPFEGNGGLRARDSMEICAKDASGKTSLANHMITKTQKRYPGRSIVCFFSEIPDWDKMEQEGVNIDDLIIVGEHRTMGEDALEAILDFCVMPEIKLTVIDSIAAIAVNSNEGKALKDSEAVAGLAKVYNRFSSQFFKRTYNSALLQLNHYRDPLPVIGKLGSANTPNPLRVLSPGGRTKDFLSKVRGKMEASPIYEDEQHGFTWSQKDNKNKRVTGIKVNCQLFRNKYAPPLRLIKVKYDCETFRWNNEETILRMANYFAYKDGEQWASSLKTPVWKQGSNVYINGSLYARSESEAVEKLILDQDLLWDIYLGLVPRGQEFFQDEIEQDLDG